MPAIDTLAVRRSLAIRDPARRGAAFLEALGWCQDDATVHWPPTPQAPGRFILNDYPTEAGIILQSPASDLETAWVPAWWAGHRWSVVPAQDVVWWFDLDGSRAWNSAMDAEDLRPLSGLTPEAFRRVGRLEPHSDRLRAVEHREHASQYLVAKIGTWWEEFFASSEQAPEPEPREKERFVRFLAGILLLRTVEDVGRSSWLAKGSLADAARRASAGVDAPLRRLFAESALRLNSRVLQGVAEADFPPEQAGRILRETYEIDVDFSALDVDPVGAFYEGIVGSEYGREPLIQTTLFGLPDMAVRPDRSARRLEGVYYTPRAYADTLAALLVRPKVRVASSPEELPRILDVAAGSGELLCAGLREVLAEPAWRTPEVALHVLDRKIQGVDVSRMGLQLCALNLLRTAIRHVPELLEGGHRLPALEENLVEGDALSCSVLDRLPEADVALINPPFHGARNWELRSADPIPELAGGPLPNQAFAFTLAALRALRPGGGLGAILPSQLFSGTHSDKWRRRIAEMAALDLVVANYASPFPDVQSYAGILAGYRRGPETWRAPTRVVRIEGALRMSTADVAALLADGGRTQPLIESTLLDALDGEAPSWLPGAAPRPPRKGRVRKISLADLLGSPRPVHHAVVVAPESWGRDLFLFERLPDGTWRHCKSKEVLGRTSSPSLRPVAWPNRLLPKIPVWCEPQVPDLCVFHPGNGVKGISLESLRSSDPVGYEAGRVIEKWVRSSGRSQIAPSSRGFVRDLEAGLLRFHLPKGYAESARPRLICSKTSRSLVGRSRGIAWSTWVNLDGSVVPIGGLHLSVERPEVAAAVATWMGSTERVRDLLAVAAPRHLGTTEPQLNALAAWEVPDLDAARLEPRLIEHYEAFLAYREEASSLSGPESQRPNLALELPSFREVLKLGEALWRD